MSSPAPPPETTPPADEASPPLILPLPLGSPVTPPTPLPLPPMAVIVSSPLLSPPAPPLTPSPDPSSVSPASSPSLPSLPSIPPESPPQAPLISPPAPALSSNPPSPPAPEPALSSNPPAPALSSNPPAPVITTKPEPTSSSTPATATPSALAPQPPARTNPSPRWRHSARSPGSSSSRSNSTSSRGSKTLPSTTPALPPPAPAAAEPAAGPTSQPSPGGGSTDVMPLTAEKPAPQPSVPLAVGGGSRPAMAVLPVGANGGSEIQAATAGSGGGTPTAGVSTGIISGLCVGGVVLVALLVFGILLVFCKRKKGCRFDDCSSFACNSKADSQGKLSLPTYTKRNTSFPDTQIIGGSKGSSTNSASTMALVSVPLAVPSTGTFTYEELVSATNGFSESNLLGQGGFGYVHKGVLPNGKEVAVKQLKLGGQQGEREFRAEVDTISQVHHKHLVSLVGYCIAGVERLLVYEFVPNQTMEFHLHGKDQPVMDWRTRLKIAIGSAKGLAYLHEDCNPTIIHRDIKAANILLDFNCEVKVSDFGLAKIFSSNNSSITHITTRVVGTFGYLAPEYASSGKVTDKSDVYSYGVTLLELITGRPPINMSESAMNSSLVNWARPLLPQAIEEGNFDTLVDPRLQNNYNVGEMANMVACAAACVRLSARRRPRMSQVIRALEGDLSPSDLDDGVRPGHSSIHFPYESLDFDAQKYMEDMRKLRMALSSNNNEGDNTTGRYSDNTSEYGLQPSISSADSHELSTRSFHLGRD